MGYRQELPTVNVRIEAVRARIAERKQAEQVDDTVYIGFDKPAKQAERVPRSGEQGLRLNRKQRRLARRKRKQAEQAAIERMRYAMYAQEARANYDALEDHAMVLQDQNIDLQERVAELEAQLRTR